MASCENKTEETETEVEKKSEETTTTEDRKLTFLTEEQQGQCIKFSPFSANRLAVSATTEFGHQGEGYIYIIEKNEDTNELDCLIKIDYKDIIYDCAWTDKDPNLICTAAGDGWVQIWNLGSKYPKVPANEFKGHLKEMSSVDWNLTKFSDLILAGSHDGTVCTYDVISQWPITKVPVSELSVNSAIWSPHSPKNFICVSSDGLLQLYDMNSNPPKSSLSLSASDEELLCVDWCKYYPYMVATAGFDSMVKGWDLRNYSLPLFVNEDHGQAVKKIKFSPFHQTLIASASYDNTVRIFDYQVSSESLEIINHHTEYVYGVDWNLHKNSELGTIGWDSSVHLCVPKCLKTST